MSVRRAFGWIWSNTDNLTKWIQVLALGVAAYWAYTRYIRLEAPSVELRADVNIEIKEQKAAFAPDSCFVRADVEVKNSGVTSFDVGQLRAEVWQRPDLPQPGSVNLNFLDVNQIETGSRLTTASPIPRRSGGTIRLHEASCTR